MNRRYKLHNELCDILSCPYSGSECRAYFQPPSAVKMQYPAIVYSLNDIDTEYANNRIYKTSKAYTVTIIDKNPDSELVDKLLKSSIISKFDRDFTSDNLNHFVFKIMY